MRFLFLTDSHWRHSIPRYRMDNILQSQMAELDELQSICAEYSPEFLVHGGDVFHLKFEPHAIVSAVMDWSRKLGKPIHAVLGNHCLEGYNVESVPRTALGTLFSSGYFSLLQEIILPKDKVIIKGVEARTDPTAGDYFFDEKYNDYFKVVVTHNYLSDHDLPFPFLHVKDVKTNANLVLSGHLHEEFYYFNGATHFANPGAFSKWEINNKDRILKVLIIDTHPFKYQIIPLKTDLAQWDLEQIEMERKKEFDLSQFAESLKNTEFELQDVEQLILNAASVQSVPQDVLNLALAKVSLAKEELK